jgi:hypothetical protein
MADTIANLIDKLTICNIKIFVAEDIKRDPGASDKEIADATKKTNTLNSLRNFLMEEIDLELNKLIETQQPQKLFGQGSTKMYGPKKK